MPIFKFLHVVSMFLAFGVAVGSDLMLYRIAQTRDARVIRVAFAAAWKYTTIAQLQFVVGMIFGLIAAFLNQFNFFALWLIIAYVLLATVIIIRGSVTAPWQMRVLQAANRAGEGEWPELEQLLDDPYARNALWAYIAMLVIIVYAMVMKPGGIE